MKALILSDLCMTEDGAALLMALVAALEARGWQVTSADLTQVEVKPCLVCESCAMKHPGECVHHDGFAPIFQQIPKHDVLVLAGRTRFGVWTPTLKLAIDRFLPLLVGFYTRRHGEIHHQQRYALPTRLLGLGWAGSEGERELVERLVDRHGRNWAVRTWASSVATTPGGVLEGLSASLDTLEAA